MEAFGIVVVVAAGILAVIGFWVISKDLDKNRMRDYIHQQGGRVVSSIPRKNHFSRGV